MNDNVVIIGGGSVGTNTSIFLKKLGFEVELFESDSDILQGAPKVTFVNHGDGFEYYKPKHQRTGQYCIDGSFFKNLVYPIDAFRTNVCTEDTPIRFLISKESENVNGLTLDTFIQNAQRMKNYFAHKFRLLRKELDMSEMELKNIFGRSPNTFFHVLRNSEFEDVTNVVGGCAGSSFGINMPHYYALLNAALREVSISVHTNSVIDFIERNGNNYLVHANGKIIKAACILISAGHHIPKLLKKIQGVQMHIKSGMYYLNCITFIRLPATSNQDKLAKARHINFTLQAEGGGMFACVVPPTQDEEGFGVLYYPSPKGSQLRSCFIDNTVADVIPTDWDNLIATDIDKNDINVQKTFEQACKLYPFLRDYAEIIKGVCRPVFNPSTYRSDKGRDRRVREISHSPIIISQDGKISMWSAPKWTNSELVSLMAADHVCSILKNEELPKSEKIGFGPTNLNIVKISQKLNFQSLKMDVDDALNYARRQEIPLKIVNTGLIQFK